MIDKLKNAELRYLEIEKKLGDPEIVSNPAEYTKLMKDYKNLTPLIEAYRALTSALDRQKEANEILIEKTDEEMVILAQEELADANEHEARLMEEI